MAIEEVVGTVIEARTLKNKAKGIAGIISGFVLFIAGIVVAIAFKSIIPLIFSLFGIIIIIFSVLGIKGARKTAELDTGIGDRYEVRRHRDFKRRMEKRRKK